MRHLTFIDVAAAMSFLWSAEVFYGIADSHRPGSVRYFSNLHEYSISEISWRGHIALIGTIGFAWVLGHLASIIQIILIGTVGTNRLETSQVV